MKPLEVGQFLIADPRVCFGKLTFRGTRVPVKTVLYFLSTGRSIDKILAGWPELRREAVEEAIRLAAIAWPELMQEQVAESIKELAATLNKRRSTRATATDEPTRTRRSAG